MAFIVVKYSSIDSFFYFSLKFLNQYNPAKTKPKLVTHILEPITVYTVPTLSAYGFFGYYYVC